MYFCNCVESLNGRLSESCRTSDFREVKVCEDGICKNCGVYAVWGKPHNNHVVEKRVDGFEIILYNVLMSNVNKSYLMEE